MGYSELRITIRDMKRPCAPISEDAEFTVYIFHCDREHYLKHPFKGAHTQIEILPGSYLLFAKNRRVVTDLAMVNVGCNQIVCVNLVPKEVGKYLLEKV